MYNNIPMEKLICTYNVNSIRARKDLTIEWLKRTSIDILCLQELKLEEKNFPFDDFEKLGYRCYVNGQKTYNGVAICSKIELQNIKKGMGDEFFDQQARIIRGEFNDIKIINVYMPHGDLRGTEKFTYKLEFYKRFRKMLDEEYSPEEKIILLGDFNVAREDIDVYDPELLKDTIGTMPEEREALESIISWGFVDAFRYKYPDKVEYTWWDYIGGKIWKNQGMRIDYIFVTEALKESVKDIYVDLWPRRRRTPKPSDHAPLIGKFEL